MVRNKLVCALSLGVIAVESDLGGGTFNAGMTAIKLGIPLFVLSPSEFARKPKGNRRLIAFGGMEIHSSDGIDMVLEHLKSNEVKPPEQLVLNFQG